MQQPVSLSAITKEITKKTKAATFKTVTAFYCACLGGRSDELVDYFFFNLIL